MAAVRRLPDGTYEVRISVVDPTTGRRHQPRVRARSRRELDNAVAETAGDPKIKKFDQLTYQQKSDMIEWLETFAASQASEDAEVADEPEPEPEPEPVKKARKPRTQKKRD